jgi:hypothetical protein
MPEYDVTCTYEGRHPEIIRQDGINEPSAIVEAIGIAAERYMERFKIDWDTALNRVKVSEVKRV